MTLDLLIDSDALIALRRLSLWTEILRSSASVACCGYAARHELNSIWSSELEPLVKAKRVAIHEVVTRTPANDTRKTFIAAGVDKGEAEALAWLVHQPECPVFVSVDRRALTEARDKGLICADLGELAALLIARGL